MPALRLRALPAASRTFPEAEVVVAVAVVVAVVVVAVVVVVERGVWNECRPGCDPPMPAPLGMAESGGWMENGSGKESGRRKPMGWRRGRWGG